MVDGTFVKVHQHGTGAPKGDAPATNPGAPKGSGGSRGGLNTRIVALVDAMGRLVKFVLQPGQCGGTLGAARFAGRTSDPRADCGQSLRYGPDP